MRLTKVMAGILIYLLLFTAVAMAAENETISTDLVVNRGEEVQFLNCEIALKTTVTIKEGGSLILAGDCFNYGSISNEGIIKQDGRLVNEGLLENQGEFINSKVLDNQDTFNNFKQFSNLQDSKITNDSLFYNQGTVNNQGVIINNANWQNDQGSDFQGNILVGTPSEKLTAAQGTAYAQSNTLLILGVIAILIIGGLIGILYSRSRRNNNANQ